MFTLTKIRLRFRLRTLLLLPLVFAIGWYWTIWPERTMDAFVDSMLQGRFTVAGTMVDCIDCSIDLDWPANKGNPLPDNTQHPVFRLPMLARGVYACRREIMDVLRGRGIYSIPKFGRAVGFTLVVERGTVTILPRPLTGGKCPDAERVRFKL